MEISRDVYLNSKISQRREKALFQVDADHPAAARLQGLEITQGLCSLHNSER